VKKGRKRVGQPISVALTDEQLAWVDSFTTSLSTSRSQVIRDCIELAMKHKEATQHEKDLKAEIKERYPKIKITKTNLSNPKA
jgi:metal-responsive CopG/Arc/MetJ family transcriptional regulator